MKINFNIFNQNTSHTICSCQNSIIKLVKKIVENPIKYKQYCVVEGIKNILEFLSSEHLSLIKIFLSSDISYEYKEIFDLHKDKLVFVSDKILKYLTSFKNHNDIIAVFELMYDITLSDGILSINPTFIIDEVQDPGNMGTLIRTAVALHKKNIIILGGVFPLNQKVIRSSSGMISKLKIFYFKDRYHIPLEFFQDKKIGILDMGGEPLGFNNADKYKDHFLVLGNEGRGIDQHWKIKNFKVLSLAMNAEVESLNVGVAGSIIGYFLWGGLG